MTRRIAGVALVVSGALGLAGCSTGGQASEGDAKNLTVMVWGTAEDIKSIEEAAAGFNEVAPDAKVTITTGDCAVSYAACKQLIAAGDMPDVVVAGSWNYDAMVRDGVLADLTEYLAKSDFADQDFEPAALDVAKADADGKMYGLPMGFNIQSFYFNQDMFDAAGLDYPASDGSFTWEDVREWAQKLTIDANGNDATRPDFDPSDIAQYGMHFGVTDQWPNLVARSFGGAVLDGEAYNECRLEDPKTIEALEFVQSMMFEDHTAITQQLNTEEPGYQRWVTGSVAMQIGSHEQVILANAQNPDMRFDMAALPTGPAGQVTMLQAHIWAASAASESLETALSFVKYMATDGAGKQMGLIPAYGDLAETVFAAAEGEPEHVVEAQLAPADWAGLFANVDPTGIRDAVAGQDGYGQELTDVFTGAKAPAEAVEGVCAKVEAIAGN